MYLALLLLLLTGCASTADPHRDHFDPAYALSDVRVCVNQIERSINEK